MVKNLKLIGYLLLEFIIVISFLLITNLLST